MNLRRLNLRITNSISKSITKKYLVLFSTVLIIPIVIIYQIIVGYANDIIEKDIVKKNMLSADALAERLNTEISNVVLQLQLISGQNQEPNLDFMKMYNQAKHTISRSAVIQSIYFIDQNDYVLFEAPFSPHLDSQYYQYPKYNHARMSNNYAVSDLITNFRGRKVVTVATPVLNNEGFFQGVIVAELSQEYLSDILKSISTTRGGFSFIIDRKGMIIASTDAKEIGKDYSNHPLAAKITKGLFGSLRTSYQEKTSILAYKALWDQWGLGFGISEHIAFQPISKLSVALTLSFTGILLLSIFLIILGTKNIINPIVRLTHFASHFDEKQSIDELKRVKVDSKDELGILMAKMIALGISNIEKKRILEEKERYLHDMIEGIPYALITLDNNGIVTHLNRNFELLTGYTGHQLKGKHLSMLPLKYDQKDFLSLHTLHADLPGEEKETYIIDVEGQKHIVKVVTSKFYNERRESIGIITVLQDISQLKLLEEHVKQSERLALIGQVTTGIAHELKNPLAVLASSAELLKKVLEGQPQSEMADMLASDIYEEIKRMSGIVSEFLSFARTKNEEEKWIEMDRLVDKVLHLLRIKLNEAKVNVSKEYKAVDQRIKVKPDKLIQVYLNLILNSIEAMSVGGTLDVIIEEKKIRDQEWLVVEIRDNGKGISKQDLDWLFNPFFSTKQNGSGLGLTIARDIMKEHKGEMEVHSVVHVGTSVQCKFPINKIADRQ
ncbi:PAS domain S-box-containing protein [Bacillus fengqiuensis]|nr:PAS domain S-box-containing protein [Bacillus fengqiuensis]